MSCPRCGFTHNCICAHEPQLSCEAHFVLLTHPNEYHKATNTGVLMARTLPHCRREQWERTNPPASLLEQIADPRFAPWLLFPADDQHPAIPFTAPTPSKAADSESTTPIPLFILLDATWQEARKMVRKSPWLAELPRLSLTVTQHSNYQLRRNQTAGNLCTCETGIALLELLEQPQQASQLAHYFASFNTVFHAERSGHTHKA
ncbi:DTW domain-containing protein [Photobacterium jeanii]|uniref:tRNA-uridine aminocarboxypropyltransferase n=1 Tax=Photobacterium jeanii TaxID=858640 RepID=A0A178KK36_9GAMM|nr:DTW domain-containing protein [Photobacterium jeanii]OAN16932.1 DTW domain-containing protein [Photobacterium jeanii]PST88222.1 DTW domain-containing protein [Photobacterium jeanii]